MWGSSLALLLPSFSDTERLQSHSDISQESDPRSRGGEWIWGMCVGSVALQAILVITYTCNEWRTLGGRGGGGAGRGWGKQVHHVWLNSHLQRPCAPAWGRRSNECPVCDTLWKIQRSVSYLERSSPPNPLSDWAVELKLFVPDGSLSLSGKTDQKVSSQSSNKGNLSNTSNFTSFLLLVKMYIFLLLFVFIYSFFVRVNMATVCEV